MTISVIHNRRFWIEIVAALIGFSLCLSDIVFAGEERAIDAEEIYKLLSDARVVGKGFEQTFGDPRGHASASTTYWEGNNSSHGRWRVEGNRYCSQWGQSGPWSCYKMTTHEEGDGRFVVWIDNSGRRFEGLLQAR